MKTDPSEETDIYHERGGTGKGSNGEYQEVIPCIHTETIQWPFVAAYSEFAILRCPPKIGGRKHLSEDAEMLYYSQFCCATRWLLAVRWEFRSWSGQTSSLHLLKVSVVGRVQTDLHVVSTAGNNVFYLFQLNQSRLRSWSKILMVLAPPIQYFAPGLFSPKKRQWPSWAKHLYCIIKTFYEHCCSILPVHNRLWLLETFCGSDGSLCLNLDRAVQS